MTESYYTLKSRQITDDKVVAHYDCHIHAQGAWNPNEQHMAPATGLLTTELEAFMPRQDMRIVRISLDIFGLIHFGEFTITTKVIRPGRTIELIESTLHTPDKVCIVARAWRLQTRDTKAVAGLEDADILKPDELPDWDGMRRWGGGYINTIYTKADPNNRSGQGIVWINTDVELVSDQGQVLPTSDFAHLMGLVDTANGIAPKIYQPDSIEWAFPNVDLQIHLLRAPEGRWLGLESTQQISEDGVGLTSSVLHDEKGVFGHSEQILTVRQLVK